MLMHRNCLSRKESSSSHRSIMKSLFVCALIISSLGVAIGCSCDQPDLQDFYCNSEFFALVEILRGPINCNGNHCYDVQVVRRFKTSSPPLEHLTTAEDGAMCGVDYWAGQQVVVTGNPNNSSMRVGLCGYDQNWSNLNDGQRQQLQDDFNSVRC